MKIFLTIIALSFSLFAAHAQTIKDWPKGVRSFEYKSSLDGSMQPSLIYTPESSKEKPLLVALHTWSGGYTQAGGQAVYARWCIENDWHMVHPHFRGPNKTPKAMGSEYVVRDILDVVNYMKQNYNIDEKRIYLVGVSGGGYTALLMAGRAPEVWAGVSAWCPISDVEMWWRFHSFKGGEYKAQRYAQNIESAVEGRPDKNKSSAEECIKRSPVTHLGKAIAVNLDINHGVFDGRKGSVPFTHSLYAFNKVASGKDKFTDADIQNWYKTQKLPKEFKPPALDELYGKTQPLYRRTSGNSRVTIFNGRHEIIHKAALNWLSKQRKGDKAVWDISGHKKLKTSDQESQSNK